MRRLPLVPTLVVALAVATMIALGAWQLFDRLPTKEALLVQLAANPSHPPVAFPRTPDDRLLFRRAIADCRPPVTITRAGAGAAGYRLIAQCRSDAAGPGIRVQLGTTRDPAGQVEWSGGRVIGRISHAPDPTPSIVRLVRPRPQQMLLVADRPVPGLAANLTPDVSLVPNNHLAYGFQWFFFAGVAALIYALALRRRRV